MMHVRKPASPQKFRKMTWLETRNASCATQPLSPAKAMVLYKAPAKGVRPFKLEKHSRLSSVGSHILSVRSMVDGCGLSHEEEIRAREMPTLKAISTKPEMRLGAEKRFQGPRTHFVVHDGTTVESCGLSHDEVMRAKELPERKAVSTRAEAGLGGMEGRFEGPHTHFVKGQGADGLLGQPEFEITPAAATIPKNNWLKNLWATAGTAMEDREMRECDAIMAPTLPVHREPESKGSVVAKMSAEGAPRFTYQRPTIASKLGGYTSHEMVWQTKGQATMRPEKHSRFSTYGSHYYPKHA